MNLATPSAARASTRGWLGDGLLWRLLAISPSEASFARRGFAHTPARSRLEAAGSSFVDGYNRALRARSPLDPLADLALLPAQLRGFRAEGMAMGAAVRTGCAPWRDVLTPLLAALTERYVHLAHVGVGWAMARMPFARRRLARMLDPMLAPLALDGRGFHDGYFHPGAAAAARRPAGAFGPVYDQGVGRSLWFSCGADPDRIAAVLQGVDPRRRDDLWAGLGLACVYAGGAGAADLDRLCVMAGRSLRWVRQGAAFAVGAHARAGTVPAEAEAAATRVCGAGAAMLVAAVDAAYAQALRDPVPQPGRYQAWRCRVAAALEQRGAA
ncbi:MAG: enediyne biosynthesis protein [Sphingomonadales bacterium]|jgi:hypothetical protein|nr:enediyne biosynthesis protein [Sphingomonadales bacterium]